MESQNPPQPPNLSKPRSPRQAFKPNIKLAECLVGSIALLQKSCIRTTPRYIKKCMRVKHSPKDISDWINQVPAYLKRGVELGIFRKRNGCYKLGDFEVRTRRVKIKKRAPKNSKNRPRTKKMGKDMPYEQKQEKVMEVIKEASCGMDDDIVAIDDD